MRRTTLLLSLILLLLLAACRGGGTAGPTPFPTPGNTATPGGAGPVALNVTDLMAAPGLYVDTVVQLTGLLRRQPVLVCESEPHPSPATWGLAEGGLVALAGGYDQQVRSLLPDDLTVTAEGRWRRWEGLVGCGKSATQREVWYLDVSRILSPSPLTQVTLTPGVGGGEGTSVAGLPPTVEGGEATIEPPVGPTEEGGLFPTPSLEETPTFPGVEPTDEFGGFDETPFPTFPSDEQTPFGTPPADATLPPEQLGTPSATPTLPGTGTPAGTPTPTVTGTPPSATPTGTVTSGQTVQRGDVYGMNDTFTITTLAAGVTDVWTADLFEEEWLEVYAIAPAPADVVLSLILDGQMIVNRQNTAPAGQPEALRVASVTTEGTYEIHVSIAGGTATDYAINANVDPDFLLTFMGVLDSGSPRTGIQLPEGSEHYWFFTAEAGDQVTIRVSPANLEDTFFETFGLDAEIVPEDNNYFDDRGPGDDEEAVFTVDRTGLYVIRVGENASDTMTYDVSATIQ
jgi:hypothetical protein